MMTAPPPAFDEKRPPVLMTAVLRYYRVSILVVTALLFAGAWSFITLPRGEDPDFDAFDLRIVTTYPGADPATVENLVTRPIEEAISELNDVKAVEATSISGLSLFKVTVQNDAEPREVVEEIREKIDEIGSDLPEHANDPVAMSFNTGEIPLVIVSITGSEDYRTLNQWATRIRSELRELEGISSVEIEGMPERQILIDVDNERLAQLRIPLSRIAEIVRVENASIPGGTLDVGSVRYLMRNPNEYRDLAEIGDTVVGQFGDSLVLLRDVAAIRDSHEDPPRYLVRTNSKTALLLSVVKRGGTNTVAVAARVRETLDRLRPSLPPELELRLISDRGQSVAALLGTLGWNALGGGLIVVTVVSLFLGVRQGLVVSVSIPLAVLISLTVMRLTGVDLNQVSIFGLVLALGMLVDSGLVVVENIGRQVELGLPLTRAVIVGVDEVKMPVLASTLTTIAAFAPMLILQGNLGAFMAAMPLAVIYSLSGSLLVAFTVIPLLCYTLWRRFPPPTETRHETSRAIDLYTEVAKWALRNRFITLLAAASAFALSLATIPILGLQLFPKAEKSFFSIDIRLPGEANIQATSLIATRVEEVLATKDGIRDYTVNIGKGGPMFYYNVERERERTDYAQVLVNLEGGTADGIVAELEPELRRIAGATVVPKILVQGPIGGAPIQVRVAGPDLHVLAGLAREIRQRAADITGITDLRDNLGDTTPQIVLDLDRRKAGLLGVDSFNFSRTILMALNGETATRYRGGGDEIPVVVRLDRRSVRETSSLERLYLPSSQGTILPFTEIASIREVEGFATIVRRDGRRVVTVEADTSGRLADDVLHDVQLRLADLPLPDGYSISFGGEEEERRESFAGLWEALILALLLIYAMLAIQFNSFVQPIVILLTVPLGLTGALFGLLITGSPFGLMSFIGVVSLTGIIINDSIVLTDFANYLQRVEGKRRLEALLGAGRLRFRPVIVTSITTIGGLTPLAIWGGNLWSPLACAVIFGLIGATILILIVLPVIYSILVRTGEGRREFRYWSVLNRRLLGG
jgi:multidrug efflux pump subunit AcrB